MSIAEALIDNMAKKINVSRDNSYIAEDGLLHCKTCGGKLQIELPFQGKLLKVGCICKCDEAKEAERKEAERQQDLDRQRKICFHQSNMASWTFANDYHENEKLSAAMKRYCADFSNFKREGKGLLLYGTVGTGKTYYAACVANQLIDEGYTVLMTNFSQLVNKLQGMYEGKDEYIESLNRYSLLIIDDLGVERNTDFMQEIVFNIIDSRYRSGLPMIITTNLTAEEIKKPQEVGYARIYDRILERCFPIEISGGSRRRKELKDSFESMKGRLGL